MSSHLSVAEGVGVGALFCLLAQQSPAGVDAVAFSGSVVVMIDVWWRASVARGCDGPAEPEGAENSSAPSDQHLRAFVAELQSGIHRR